MDGCACTVVSSCATPAPPKHRVWTGSIDTGLLRRGGGALLHQCVDWEDRHKAPVRGRALLDWEHGHKALLAMPMNQGLLHRPRSCPTAGLPTPLGVQRSLDLLPLLVRAFVRALAPCVFVTLLACEPALARPTLCLFQTLCLFHGLCLFLCPCLCILLWHTVLTLLWLLP